MRLRKLPAIPIPILTIRKIRAWWPICAPWNACRGRSSLTELRANPALRKVKFLKNVRLIISPVSEEEYQEILRMAGIVASPGLPLP